MRPPAKSESDVLNEILLYMIDYSEDQLDLAYLDCILSSMPNNTLLS